MNGVKGKLRKSTSLREIFCKTCNVFIRPVQKHKPYSKVCLFKKCSIIQERRTENSNNLNVTNYSFSGVQRINFIYIK